MAVCQVSADGGRDADCQAPLGQEWYGVLPGGSRLTPSTVTGGRQAATPVSPWAVTRGPSGTHQGDIPTRGNI